MSAPIVSIIIPCYNDAKFIEKAVNSALNQTYSFKEVIVVDDGSNEETKTVLSKLEPKITKLIIQKNQGQSSARNRGIEEATGKYILALDSDDFFELSFCEKAVKVFEESLNVKLVSCHSRRFNEVTGKEDLFIPHGGRLKEFLNSNGAMGSSIFRKEDWQKIDGYDEEMQQGFEDWEFFIRLLKDGGEAYIIPEKLFNYRLRDVSTSSKANKIKYDLLRFIYSKHKELYLMHYDSFVDYLLNKLEREEMEKIKNTQRLEYKTGKLILQPLRFTKQQLKKFLI